MQGSDQLKIEGASRKGVKKQGLTRDVTGKEEFFVGCLWYG